MPTSITNTSVSTDDLTVDTNVLKVDSANNRVGIGTTSPTVKLEVAGDIKESVSGANAQISAITDGASNYATFTATNGSRSYSMQIRPDQNNAFTIRDETGGGNRMLVDTSGRITTPQQPSFLVRRNSSSFTTNPNQYFPFDNKSIFGGYDVGGHFSTSTYLYTVPVTGTYFFHAYTICSTALSNGQWSIRKNGSAIHDHHISQPNTSWHHHTLTITTQCAANDTIGIYIAAAYQFYGNSWSGFMGHMLG